jgi:DNA repair protein RecO (recombination protein O)
MLSGRRFAESGLIVSVLTMEHGRQSGFVAGGQATRHRPLWQSGTHLAVRWRARLAEQLGSLSGEMRTAYAARFLDDPGRLAALSACCAISELCLPEHVAHPEAFHGLLALLDGLTQQDWPTLYVHWELGLLRSLGFGLDLASCAVSGVTEDLAYVSPKSGRAVSLAAAGPYRDRLLVLPGFLGRGGAGSAQEIADGLNLSGYFIERHILVPLGRSLPAARSRLVDRLRA